jgi:hypothetical protein
MKIRFSSENHENLFSMMLMAGKKVRTFGKHFNVKQYPLYCLEAI